MSVESPPKTGLEGLALQKVTNEAGNQISAVIRPRLSSMLVEPECPISISFSLNEGRFIGSYAFREEYFSDKAMLLIGIGYSDRIHGIIKAIKSGGKERQYIMFWAPFEGKLKLVQELDKNWRLIQAEEDEDRHLEFFQGSNYLYDQQAIDALAYVSDLVKDIDEFIKHGNVLDALLHRSGLNHPR